MLLKKDRSPSQKKKKIGLTTYRFWTDPAPKNKEGIGGRVTGLSCMYIYRAVERPNILVRSSGAPDSIDEFGICLIYTT